MLTGPGSRLPRQCCSSDELDEALGWIRTIQSEEFKEELLAIKRTEALPLRSPLIKLTPFLDKQGILRVGGRLKHAQLAYDEKHPAILPTTSPFARLVIEVCHRRTLHGGVQLTLGALRQEYWIPRSRALVKSYLHRCVTCLRWRASSPQPLMGNLPRVRITPDRF